MAKLSTYINSAAAQYNDFQTALTSILTKAGVNSSNTQKIVNKIINNEENIEPEENDDTINIDTSNVSYTSLDKYKK
jgi:predicted transcriptional regulator